MKSDAKLILFDIDGTLIDTEGAGLMALEVAFYAAFPEHLGRVFPPLELGGATDNGLVMYLFDHFGLADLPEHRIRFFCSYIEQLSANLERFSVEGRGRVLPGVMDILDALSRGDGHYLAILTGNTQAGAWVKLRHYGIDRHFSVGAYGDDHHDRNALGPIARERAVSVFGRDFLPADIAVIGDTPKDIACARAFGARVVAVASGAATRSELEAMAPDVLLDDLSDCSGVVKAIASLFSN